MIQPTSEIIIYQNPDGKIKIDVRLEEETVWLTQEQMALLFGKGRSTIAEHIQNVFKEGELDEQVVCRNFRHTTKHGAIEGKTQEKEVKYYNLDVIISVGYRVKSQQGTQFRIWATQRLKEYKTFVPWGNTQDCARYFIPKVWNKFQPYNFGQAAGSFWYYIDGCFGRCITSIISN